MAEYPPYVNAYNGIPKLFEKIKTAAVPPKFTVDFLNTVLELKSSSYRAMIPLLKKLGFLDPGNVPTQAYKDFRENSLSGSIMAQRLKEAYASLFAANEYAQNLDKKNLMSKLRSQFVPYLSGISAGQLEASRDGQWVAYVAYPEGTLWRSKPDGTETFQLTYPPMKIAAPHWSPDGHSIAFMASQPNKPSKVFLIAAAGGTPQQLTSGADRGEGDPSWSPDGNSLLYGEENDLGEPKEIQRLDLKTHQVSNVAGSDGLLGPRWSPDGRYIAALTANDDLVLFDVRTGKWRQLHTHVANAFLTWTPDSRYIYFDTGFTTDPAIFRIEISTQKVQRLIELKDFPGAAWEPFGFWSGLSPDGSVITQRDTSTQEIYALDLQLR